MRLAFNGSPAERHASAQFTTLPMLQPPFGNAAKGSEFSKD